MKILARGEKTKTDELKIKLASSGVQLDVLDDTDLTAHNLSEYQLIFDLDFDNHPHQLKYFAGLRNIPIVVSAVKVQLAAVVQEYGRKTECLLFGINALPGFLNRPLAEVSSYDQLHRPVLESVLGALKWPVQWVDDRVGMVSPRIVCMIINEACYTVQEGTAGVQDIDISMKLGTNYPMGPFEWANHIGVKNVYETLQAMYDDTHDERYKVCPLLKTHYLKNQPFGI
jgi:3-hydroxybutyryl-CoA dehydrogenase